jgi:NifB/MoaA-like Fe-S oxidoreductase
LKSDAEAALEDIEETQINRHISLVTGVASEPLIKYVAELCSKKAKGLECDVYGIKNNFFGELITVTGLVTATDIYEQLKDKDLGEELLIPSAMLRKERDMFLDSITVDELSEKLNVKITVVECDGYSLTDAILGC